LVGALGIAVADAVRGAARAATGHGGELPGALVTLAAFRGASMAELQQALGLSQPGTVRVVDRLVTKGWVERRPGLEGRSVALELTSAGGQAAQRLRAERERALATLLHPLNEAERVQLAGLVDKILWSRAHAGRDPRHLCRLCDRDVCDPCPVADGAWAARTTDEEEPC